MNKEKIVGLSDRLNKIVDEANRHPNGTPGCITWDKAVYAIEALSKEANSKIIMPKVFDDWYKNDSTYGDPNTLKFKIIHFTVMAMWDGKGIESQERLCDWIKKAHKGKYTYDEERFVRCIEAIIHGYKVEK